jgi:hypothetical protein
VERQATLPAPSFSRMGMNRNPERPMAEPSHVLITIGERRLRARFEEEAAPTTCALFRQGLPLEKTLLHARWSGEAGWSPVHDAFQPAPHENALSYPAPGQLLLYSGGVSEPEILFPYGACAFASKAGPLAGNHFLTVVEGLEHLRSIGMDLLHRGAQPVRFELAG